MERFHPWAYARGPQLCFNRRNNMKQIIYYVILIVLLNIIHLNAYADVLNENIIYKSSIVKDKNRFITQYELADYYADVYKYALKSGKLFILGRTPDYKLLLTSLSLENREINIIRKSTVDDFVIDMNDAEFTIMDPFIIIKYVRGINARYSDQKEMNIEILKFNENNEYLIINQEKKISRNDIYWSSEIGAKDKYIYSGGYDSSNGQLPARKEIPKILLADINGDGYTDILIWKKVYRSRLIEDKIKESFVIDHEELNAMYFNKETGTFTNLEPVNWE